MESFARALSIFFVFVLSLLLGAASASAQVPPRRGWLTDLAEVIGAKEREALERELAEYERRTSNEVAVLVVASLGKQTVEDYAFEVARAWAVGKKGLDNGVLIVVSMGERKSRIETGKGVGHLLPDLVCNDILREVMGPRLRAGRTGEAVTEGARAVMTRLDALPPPPERAGRRWGWALVLGALLGLLLLYYWVRALRELSAIRADLGPGGERRRKLEAFDPTLEAIDHLFPWYPAEDAQVRAGRGRVAALREALREAEEEIDHARSFTALLWPPGTLERLEDAHLRHAGAFLWKLHDEEALLLRDLQLQLFLEARPRAATEEDLARVEELVARTVPAHRALRGLMAEKDLPCGPSPAELLERARRLSRRRRSEVSDRAVEATWMCASAAFAYQRPADLAKLCVTRRQASATGCKVGDPFLQLWAWERAERAYAADIAARHRASALASVSVAASGGGDAWGGSSQDSPSSSSYDSSSSSSYDSPSSSSDSSTSGGGGDFGGGGSSDTW